MKQLQGLGVFPQLTIGPVYVFRPATCDVTAAHITEPENEYARFDTARRQAQAELHQLYQKTLDKNGEESAAIFDIHQLMLDDADFLQSVRDFIYNDTYNAAYAVEKTGEKFAQLFAQMDDDYMKARAADVQDISHRVVRILCGKTDTPDSLQTPSVIVAEDLTPSQIVLFDEKYILGFVTAKGTANSHAAILAHTKGLAAIVSMGPEVLSLVNGQTVILDGEHGTLTVDPDTTTLKKAQQQLQAQQKQQAALQALKGTPDQTKDGRSVLLYANVSTAQELHDALQADARGIGLFRTEFLYLKSATYPTEEELFNVYRDVVQHMQGKLVVFRTLDIGADKTAPYFNLPDEENPALGLRAIRLCLTRPELFKPQLRALLRASAFGKTAIMYPMIASVSEVQQAQNILAQVKQELRQARIAFDENIQTGIMIETPAAALISDELAPLVDFFSIGTNDLTQYTCALDRQNQNLSVFTDTHHPAVLKLIALTAKNAHAAGKWVGICGELAADRTLTKTFLQMGIDELSVSAPFILPLRQAIQQTDLRQAD
ncbi:phosphoenolpyruvate--protein phosphotransferase [Candidatus Avelusimicrobium luingense]|uniref:phosphoenolpyruvate--protein phosphotransferase n=1 Tax=Candidatus Avelusimicrobium luingense TaxID=3416211 RepID=UPI003D0AAD3F